MSLPVVAEVVRGDLVESTHHGSVVGIAADGARVLMLGDVDGAIYPRSAVKPLQTVGLLRAGWDPDDEEQVALACASHSGEDEHLVVVRRILRAAGLDERDLDNTPDLPLEAAASRELLRGGGEPDRLHQNCSGKHAAMLATCVTAGWPVTGYRAPTHPVQLAVRGAVEDLAGERSAHVTVDGCGAPLFSLSLTGLARAFARLATAEPGTPERRVADAVRRHPHLVGGTGRDVTRLLAGVPGLVAKDGAEGVQAAALPDGRAVAVKIGDGSGRARAAVVVAALERLGVDTDPVAELRTVAVLGHGEPVGQLRATLS
ncbi:MAG TPA: asparaginase [Mycobacteriales bacterium]|nr:asparaginase [Mycobacteriales bacterium]